jgi:hypothetical protein
MSLELLDFTKKNSARLCVVALPLRAKIMDIQTMNIKDIVINIIYIPIKFRMPGSNETLYSLLKQSGYFETYEQIHEDMLYEALASHPVCSYAWLFYSEDKRVSSGWFFEQNSQEKYTVGYYPPNENFKKIKYSDMRKACAAFIRLEIEDIRKS